MDISDFLWRSLAIGIGGTAAMDAWAIVLNRAFGIPLPNWALVGRWFCHLSGGKVFHDDIGAAAPWRNELAAGWIAHYAVGILYAGILVFLAGPGWTREPTFLPAWTWAWSRSARDGSCCSRAWARAGRRRSARTPGRSGS